MRNILKKCNDKFNPEASFEVMARKSRNDLMYQENKKLNDSKERIRLDMIIKPQRQYKNTSTVSLKKESPKPQSF